MARLDRLNVWSLSYLFIGIIGLGFLFTFYDIFDINVSWIQSCTQLHSGCTPANAGDTLKWVLLLNLIGYALGTLVLSPISDKIGRRQMLMFTLLLTGLGSLYNALAPDFTNFVIARTITGIGVGADLAIVNAYIGEVAPRGGRARYASTIFAFSAVGALLGSLAGLILATPGAPWPKGLSFALAGEDFSGAGWRWTYAIGALLALLGLVMRRELPESPRWLVQQGRLAEAEKVVDHMESIASRRGALAPVVPDPGFSLAPPVATPYRTLLTRRLYRRRLVILLLTWLFSYATVYGFSAGYTTILASLTKNGHPVYSPGEAGVIAVVGITGIIVAAIVAAAVAERVDRRWWLPIGAVITVLGCILTAEAGTHLWAAFVGSAIIFFGFDVWVGPTYALSAEAFPTSARTTGFAVVDGVGHIGGAAAILVLAPNVGHFTPLEALLLVAAFQVVGAVLVQFAPKTRSLVLDEVSPDGHPAGRGALGSAGPLAVPAGDGLD